MAKNVSELKHTELGAYGERYARELLQSLSFKVQRAGYAGEYDLLATDQKRKKTYRVEVKASRLNAAGYYMFCLRKRDRTDISHSDVVVLLPFDSEGNAIPFAVPSDVFGDNSQFKLPASLNEYAGKISAYRNDLLTAFGL